MTSLDEAKRVLEIEAQAILDLKDRLDESFEKAVELLCECKGKVVVAGMGKSGHVGRKLAATLSSTGTPSLFLHPAESSHGDLGVVAEGDCLVVISYGGGSQELQDLLTYATRKGLSLIAMTGNQNSDLAKAATVSLDIKVKEEACPLKLAPTSSSTVSLALGDALAMAALKKKGFREEDFAEYHPGGKLGRRLLTRVSDLMHDNGGLPVVSENDSMRVIVGKMTGSHVRGVAGVVDSEIKTNWLSKLFLLWSSSRFSHFLWSTVKVTNLLGSSIYRISFEQRFDSAPTLGNHHNRQHC